MIIADQLREKNIAEYLLYMWQTEDLLRACSFDVDKLKDTVIAKSQLTNTQKKELGTWYENINDMMREEGVKEKGHLQINTNILIELNDLHLQLLHSPKYPFYTAAYYKVLPYIVEIRHKGGNPNVSELETCFEFMYGIMILRLQYKKISKDTESALKEITTLMGMLSDYYKKDRISPLEF